METIDNATLDRQLQDMAEAMRVRETFEVVFADKTVTVKNVSDTPVVGLILGDCVSPVDLTLAPTEASPILDMTPDENGMYWITVQYGRDLLYYEPPPE